MSGWQRFSVCFFPSLFFPSRGFVCASWVFSFLLLIPVRPPDRPPAGRIQSPPRLSAAMVALALAAIEAAKSGVLRRQISRSCNAGRAMAMMR
jgi:hypothetical protein